RPTIVDRRFRVCSSRRATQRSKALALTVGVLDKLRAASRRVGRVTYLVSCYFKSAGVESSARKGGPRQVAVVGRGITKKQCFATVKHAGGRVPASRG